MDLEKAMNTKQVKDVKDDMLMLFLKSLVIKFGIATSTYIDEEDLKTIVEIFFNKIKSDYMGFRLGEIEYVVSDVIAGEYGETYKFNLQKIFIALSKYKNSDKRYNAVKRIYSQQYALPEETEKSKIESLRNITLYLWKEYNKTGVLPEFPPANLAIQYLIYKGYIKEEYIIDEAKKTMYYNPDKLYVECYIRTCRLTVERFFETKKNGLSI